MTDLEMAKQIAQAVKQYGGKTYFTGGYVRDKLLGKENNDIDIEIFELDKDNFFDAVKPLGDVISFGKSYRVFHVVGYDIDISLSDKSLFDSCKRRDLTINSIVMDVLTGEIVDYFNGVNDIKKKVINYVDKLTFIQDKLRVFRVARFAAVYGFTISEDTLSFCKSIDVVDVSKERVFAELCIALTRSERPSIYIDSLKKMGKLDHWFKEVKQLIGVTQNPIYHSEGDVYTHTLMVLDQASKLKGESSYSLGFMITALCHDFGKYVARQVVDGVIHNYAHEKEGLPLVKEFLDRFTDDKYLHKYVANMVLLHMAPNKLAYEKSSIKATNKMFDKAIDKKGLVMFALADDKGRISEIKHEDYTSFLLERLEIYEEYMRRDRITGQDLKELGISESNLYKELLQYAHKLHLSGVDKQAAIKQLMHYYKELKENLDH